MCLSPYFNPRSPHGERPLTPSISARKRVFQSTLPARGATASAAHPHSHINFNPRSPHGERLAQRLHRRVVGDISIHAPRTGSDRCHRAIIANC